MRQSPPIFFIVAQYGDLFRLLANDRGLSYEIRSVENIPEVLAFHFGEMDDAALFDLLGAIPPEAHAYRAVVGSTQSPPPNA